MPLSARAHALARSMVRLRAMPGTQLAERPAGSGFGMATQPAVLYESEDSSKKVQTPCFDVSTYGAPRARGADALRVTPGRVKVICGGKAQRSSPQSQVGRRARARAMGTQRGQGQCAPAWRGLPRAQRSRLSTW